MSKEEIRCIYCGDLVDTSKHQGDHIIPAALGEFRNDERFRHICITCNNEIGKSEQQLLRCGPERIFRDIVVSSSSRSRGKKRGWVGAGGAPPPQVQTLTQAGTLSVEAAEDTSHFRPYDQLVVCSEDGTEHEIRLYPEMSVADLRQRVSSLGVGVVGARINCDERNEDAYSKMLKEIWPTSEYQRLSTTEPGQSRVLLRGRFQVNDRYFRAYAKIAFHYYLVHSVRCKGDEDEFLPIRQFIMDGGDADQFFVSGGPFQHTDPNMVPSWWCHVLAASEKTSVAIAYVCLFRGPQSKGIEYTVRLGTLPSRIIVPNASWIHAYKYDRPVPDTGKVGTVTQGSITWVLHGKRQSD